MRIDIALKGANSRFFTDCYPISAVLAPKLDPNPPPIAARASGPAMPSMPPLPERKTQRTVAQQIAASEPVSEYARRPAPQGLDAHGRPAPVAATPQGDDHLDIPAFLRRQAT